VSVIQLGRRFCEVLLLCVFCGVIKLDDNIQWNKNLLHARQNGSSVARFLIAGLVSFPQKTLFLLNAHPVHNIS
jgi:hypothetical protein